MSRLQTCPEPGIYRDVPMDVYHSWDAVGNSLLGQMAITPAHYIAAKESGTEQTEAMLFGTATHMALLEPARFAETFEMHIPGSRATKPVKADIERIEAMGRVALRPAEWSLINFWRDNLPGDVAQVLRDAEDREVSIVWDQMVEGKRVVRCKCRPDLIAPFRGARICVDIKTARAADPVSFGHACRRYGYHRARAHYLAGLAAVGMPCEEYAFAVFEKSPPHLIAAYRLDAAARDAGENEWWRLLSLVAECEARGDYPGYPPHLVDLAVPVFGGADDLELTMSGEALEV